MTELESVRYGNTDIQYTVVRSARRKKTIEISIDPEHRVVVAAPAAATSEALREIVLRRATWVLTRLERARLTSPAKTFVSGETMPYMGREVRMDVLHSDVEAVRIQFTHWAFAVEVPSCLQGEERQHQIQAAFTRWYRRRAGDAVRRAVARWSAVLSLTPSRVALRDQRRRWGSCAPDGSLRFNWRIVMAEPALLEYVVAHELAHLKHRNHSREFWATVEQAIPGYHVQRARLREFGDRLPF